MSIPILFYVLLHIFKCIILVKTFQFDAVIVSLTVRRPSVSWSPAGLRLINALFYRLNPTSKRTNVHYRQYRSIAGIAAAEKRPLSYQTP